MTSAPSCNCGEEMDVERGLLLDVVRCQTGECRCEGARFPSARLREEADPERIRERLETSWAWLRDLDPREVRDEAVDRLVIREQCVHEPCTSRSWMKVRAVLVAVVPALATFSALTAWGASAVVTVGVSLLLGVGIVRLVAVRVRVVRARTECVHVELTESSG